MSDEFKVAANQNMPEWVTLEAIERNPWNAVDRPLPEDADRSLLERVAFAAQECAKAAFAAARVAKFTDPDRAESCWVLNGEAVERCGEARQRLRDLPEAERSKVSPFLDRKELQEKAVIAVLAVMADERGAGPRATITGAEIDRNPWSILWSDASRLDTALLARVRDTAVGLVREAFERRDERSYTAEEAALWNSYAEGARNTYLDADRKLQKAALGIEITQEPGALTIEAIGRNRWNAVERDIPADASQELLSVIVETAGGLAREFEGRAAWSVTDEEAAEWRGLSREALERAQEADARLLVQGWQQAKALACRTPETDRAALIDMLGEGAYRAINEPVPGDADAQTLERLSDELDVALDRLDALRRSSEATGISPQYIDEQFETAGARQEEVEERLQEALDEIARRSERQGENAGKAYAELPSGNAADNRLAEYTARVLDFAFDVLLSGGEADRGLAPQDARNAANPEIDGSGPSMDSSADEVFRRSSVYENYPGLTRDADQPERGPDDGRSR